MSCINPVTILHPSRYFNSRRDKAFLQVPCGKCYACECVKRNDWCVRSYYEYLDTKSKGGTTMMILLTYRDSCLPRFDKLSCVNSSAVCFSAKDVRRFINSLKQYFIRHGLPMFKYLICSEFGEQYGRPHYHCLFNILGISPAEFKKLLDHYWHYGRVSPDKPLNELIVHSFEGIVYTSKYVTKDIAFYKDYGGLFEEEAKRLSLSVKELLQKISDLLPRRYTSYKYGVCILDSLGVHLLPDGTLRGDLDSYNKLYSALNDGIRFEFDNKFHRLPRYIVNKLRFIYEKDGVTEKGNTRYKSYYSPLWIDYKYSQLDKIISQEAINIQHDLSFMSLNLVKLPDGITPNMVKDAFNLSHLTYRDLAQYKICCLGRSYDVYTLRRDFSSIDDFINYGVAPSRIELSKFDKFVRDSYIESLCIMPTSLNSLSYSNRFEERVSSPDDIKYRYDDLPIFENHLLFIALSDIVRHSVNSSVQNEASEKFTEINNILKFYSHEV